MNEYTILNPEFVDLQKTKVRFTLVKNGLHSLAEFTVPENRQLGVNEYWDKIVSEFDIEEMRQRRNHQENIMIQEQEFLQKKHLAEKENQEIAQLFDLKSKVFDYFFVRDSTREAKSAIRRAPDTTIVNAIVSHLVSNYIEKNNLSVLDFLNVLEESEENIQETK